MGGTADGLIGATGTAMQQQMDRPAGTALEQGGGDALLRPGEITTTGRDDDDRAMHQHRRRQEAKVKAMQRPGPLQQRTSSWTTEQTNGASCPRISLPQALGSWPLAQPLFYQCKRTKRPAEPLQGNGSTQSRAMRWRT